MPDKTANETASSSNFIKQRIDADLAKGTYAQRRWSGEPGLAAAHAAAGADPAKIRTRFPPEPNGYLHVGHAKSICVNFGLAEEYGGVCHMRFDDTNPEKEEQEFVDGILDAVHWLGFHWGKNDENLYHASDYFGWMYEFAVELIKHGDAYVDSQSADEVVRNRGTFQEPGKNSPFRARSVDENLKLFDEMRGGKHGDGTHVLRAKIDMASPNINLRDPALYRIKNAEHHRTGDKWHIYPMYSYAHPIEDALENITHSLCTLEFEDQRPFYDWVLEKIASFGLLQRPLPQQIEFARLNLTYTVMSKRYLKQLVDEKHVDGWADPRMPTIVGMRKRGYPPEAIRLFMERVGVSKADQWIEPSVLEDCVREVLNETVPRRIAVLDPVKLVITNYPEGGGEESHPPNHPQKKEWGARAVPFSRELWIERDDFMEYPAKGFFRLSPGSTVRLKYAYVIRCTGFSKDVSGKVVEVQAEYMPDSKSGTPGADNYKVKGVIHWLCAKAALARDVTLYDRLFKVSHPGKDSGDYLKDLNPDSLKVIRGYVEPSLGTAKEGEALQFERHGYFRAGKDITRIVTLRDSWGK
ncbi:glutamine--tRNA ligase/YqeY domain fusion protein [Usitatibacter palustris]|uniref:Glutamine--tRNA ligase n=1 Tax=Usitatibacter palustris TaxID=2732487 RepID=A0A6M4H395_9PROT|nr:glutamine--tRNA ligase/YqeY domain fusion protein [Usitatibacter palustris]QJR13805.1 Glutamine--tRNA ligase [Usitatibacter palustris]